MQSRFVKRQEQGHQEIQSISKEELPKEAYQSTLQDIRARDAFTCARRSLEDTTKPEEQMEQTDQEEKMEQEEPRGAKRSNIYIYLYMPYICQKREAYTAIGSLLGEDKTEQTEQYRTNGVIYRQSHQEEMEPYIYITYIYVCQRRGAHRAIGSP